MLMPETAMNKNRNAVLRQHNIGTTRKVSAMEAKTVSKGM
jgi:hypothetical protein